MAKKNCSANNTPAHEYLIEAEVGLTTEYFIMGKGSKPRPVDKEKYDRNFDRIFNSHCKCQQPVPDYETELCRRCAKPVKFK